MRLQKLVAAAASIPSISPLKSFRDASCNLYSLRATPHSFFYFCRIRGASRFSLLLYFSADEIDYLDFYFCFDSFNRNFGLFYREIINSNA